MYKQATQMYSEGDFASARDKYAILVKKYPGFDVTDLALFQAGYISYYNLNDVDSAINYFSQLEEKFEKDSLTQHVKSEIRQVMASGYRSKGFEYLREKKYLEAIIAFDKALDISPLDSVSLSGSGLGMYWLNNKEGAIGRAEEIEKLYNSNTVAVINSMFILINSGRVDEAIKLGESTLRTHRIDNPEFYYNLGYAYLMNIVISNAVSKFSRTIKIDPEFIYAYNNLGCSLWTMSRYNEATKKFKEAIDIDPKYVDAHFNLGITYYFSNRLIEAYAEFKTALSLDPQYAEAKKYIDNIQQALAYTP
jgi:tetratricopeptide (TPR) repeat protein